MNRLFLAILAVATAMVTFSSCNDDSESFISFGALPSAAQTTITTHFDADDISLIVYDKAPLDKEYTVTFFDGTIIDFDKNGAWESIKSYNVGVPTSIIPTTIADYLATNYSSQKVVELDKDDDKDGGYDVELDNSLGLEFNSSGVLIGID